MPTRSVEHNRLPSRSSNGPDRSGPEIWISAISRLQAQVTYNTGMIDGHRRQFQELENNINRLHHDIGGIAATLDRVTSEMRSTRSAPEGRPDSGDLEILTSQVTRLSHKVNEVDALGMALELLKNRIRKCEEVT
ncbi:uncharacterized protein K489DRAFT_318233, partial [Dissoconium aciculare CBS 342.82]|uniref:Uncharacterized protein n=1 Tax=Dissoconium aciculare CBS 342.82 TaxID=1314786 RepID=A0A6J3M6P5_9PEZI